MIDFRALNKEVCSVALVGQYLQAWALMENSLNRLIEGALKLDNLSGLILTKNIQFRDKINIAKTLVDQSFMYPNSDISKYKKALKRVGTLSVDRNLIAHDAFYADPEGDGVRFLVVKATGNFAMPDISWSISDFLNKYSELDEIADVISEIKGKLDFSNRIRSAMAQTRSATPVLGGLGLLGSLYDQYQSDPSEETVSGQEIPR